mmetsp:Transcript_6587/g.18994  ORF Transcript_6587/g.18994 Transcript_6587/m.18994 type:complete len:261 (+) Transcript_6587:1000-1782(+)
MVQPQCQRRHPRLLPDVVVLGPGGEELGLGGAGSRHADAGVEVVLGPVHHPHVPQPQRHRLVAQHRRRIRTPVHYVQLRQHTNRAMAIRIHQACHLQGVAVDDVRVGGGHGQDDAGGVADVVQDHGPGTGLDVAGLVAHRHLGQPRQVHQRHGKNVGAGDLEANGSIRYPAIGAGQAISLRLDLLPDLLVIVKALSLQMQELTKLRCGGAVCPWVGLHQLKHQWTPGTYLRTPRQEVPPHQALQHAGFAAALASHDRHLR